jgi:hypothetical protein
VHADAHGVPTGLPLAPAIRKHADQLFFLRTIEILR